MFFQTFVTIFVALSWPPSGSGTLCVVATEAEDFCYEYSQIMIFEANGLGRQKGKLKIINSDLVDFHIDKFSSLRKITFIGHEFQCDDLRWKTFIQEAVANNVFLEATHTSCTNGSSLLHSNNFLHDIINTDVNAFCPPTCSCQMNKFLLVKVSCRKLSWRDADLPTELPYLTSFLDFTENHFTDVSVWLNELLVKLHFVCTVNLAMNWIGVLPTVPPTMNPISAFHFQENNITKMSKKALESYLHYDRALIALKDNPLICDCKISEFVEFLRTYPERVDDYEEILCSDGEMTYRPWMYENPSCKNASDELISWTKFFQEIFENWDIILLVSLNLLLVGVWIDIERALGNLRKPGIRNERIPLIYHLIVQIQVYFTNLRERIKSLAELTSSKPV